MMESVEPIDILPDRPIYHATLSCQGSFEKCQGLHGLNTNKWAENRLADFNLWASGIGASVSGRASLDSRLSLRPDIQETVTNLLQILQNLVTSCIELAHGGDEGDVHHLSVEHEDRDAFDSGSRTPSPHSDISSVVDEPNSSPQKTRTIRAMNHVDNILEQLAQISLAIRRTGRHSRLQRADRAENREGIGELEEFRRHLIVMVSLWMSSRDEDTCNSQLPNPDVLSDIQRRLISCNVKRRHRFLYAQAHTGRKTLSEQPIRLRNVEEDRSDQIVTSTILETSKKALPIIDNKQLTKPLLPKQVASVKTATTATAMTSPYEHPIMKKSGDAATQMSVTVTKIKYPRISISKEKQLFKCPCCCQPLPVMFAEYHRWKKHLAEDLHPYTCILPNCDEPEQLYATKEAWREHLSQGHENMIYWECFMCPGVERFEQEDIFIAHIHQLHSETISNDQIPALLPALRHSMPSYIESCPLCLNQQEGQFNREALFDHIAEHVHEFSLYALPWGSETEENGPSKRIERNSSTEAENRTDRWADSSLATLQQQQDDQDNKVDIEDNLSWYKSWIMQMDLSVDRSFADLQESTVKRHYFDVEDNIYFDCDRSITSSDPNPYHEGPKEMSFHWNVPHSRNPDISDISAELASLHDQIFSSQLLVICGPPGIGKTELARELCFQVREKDIKADIDRSIFWIDATNDRTPGDSCVEIVEQMEGTEFYHHLMGDDPDLVAEEVVYAWLVHGECVPWLLIIDGDADPFNGYLPVRDKCCIIITTRDETYGFELLDKDAFMNPSDLERIQQKKKERIRSATDQDEAKFERDRNELLLKRRSRDPFISKKDVLIGRTKKHVPGLLRLSSRVEEGRRLAALREALEADIGRLRAEEARRQAERDEARRTRAHDARIKEIDEEIAGLRAQIESSERRRRAADGNRIHQLPPQGRK